MEIEVIPEVLVAVRSGEVGRLELVDMELVPDNELEVIPEVLVSVRSGEVGRLELVDVDLVPDMELVVSKAWARTMGLTEK